uniref:DnaJ heat shock protein family (Hsp40) member C4 n=1 Tax=Suricata suricatta TaxID=37032 RepID=A0A673V865_SURSU
VKEAPLPLGPPSLLQFAFASKRGWTLPFGPGVLEVWSHPGPNALLFVASFHQPSACRHAVPVPVPVVAPQPSLPAILSDHRAALHPDRDPGNPTLHSRFVELSEAYQVLSREQSRLSYDRQLCSAASPKSPGATAHPGSAQAHRSSWEHPNVQYWAQFHGVRSQGPESRRQQHKHNQRVLGYCLLIMLAGMGLHYAAFRKLEQVHRSFMDEKDRIITAIYNDTRARARANRAKLQERLQSQQLQPRPGDPGIVPPGTGADSGPGAAH